MIVRCRSLKHLSKDQTNIFNGKLASCKEQATNKFTSDFGHMIHTKAR